MHIPDGLLNTKTLVTTAVFSAGTIGYAVRRTKQELNEKQVPLMGVLGAFIFAAQMINFPVFTGTSGHLIGAVLAAVLLGPWSAVIIMSSILIIQAFFFADGGITALGANIFNMAVIAPLLGYAIYKVILKISGKRGPAVFIAAWGSVILSAVFAALEIAVFEQVSISLIIVPLAGWHVLIGLGEGIITMVVLSYLIRVKPELLPEVVINEK